jgi:hypothetical protein
MIRGIKLKIKIKIRIRIVNLNLNLDLDLSSWEDEAMGEDHMELIDCRTPDYATAVALKMQLIRLIRDRHLSPSI